MTNRTLVNYRQYRVLDENRNEVAVLNIKKEENINLVVETKYPSLKGTGYTTYYLDSWVQ